MQKEQENFYLNEDFESLENELEILSKEQVLRIEINEGLEIALQDLQNLKDKIPQEQT
ncbi:hypothetical protein [Helicobacter fennelliae]|nr:hypothetical protein [Helicobacter fennelliae]STQ84682.1 Uncharacterised protein [Helicobacter fennelliae]